MSYIPTGVARNYCPTSVRNAISLTTSNTISVLSFTGPGLILGMSFKTNTPVTLGLGTTVSVSITAGATTNVITIYKFDGTNTIFESSLIPLPGVGNGLTAQDTRYYPLGFPVEGGVTITMSNATAMPAGNIDITIYYAQIA